MNNSYIIIIKIKMEHFYHMLPYILTFIENKFVYRLISKNFKDTVDKILFKYDKLVLLMN